MTAHESALAWLEKQLKSKEMGLFRALHKVNATEEEIENLENAIEVIRYLIDLVEEDANDLVWYDTKKGRWVVGAYPEETDIHVSWWAFLPDPPEKK